MTMPRILDCTVRDGSYVVDFQFTAEDTAVIAAGLESAGVEWIEIGHGLGLNASAAGKGAAAASDDAYLRAAQETLRHAMWGMFFIPGIGRAEDLDRAAAHGMRFVRIGANAPDVAQTEPFVRQALALGLHVSVNLMKSYAVPSDRLVELSKMAESYGAQVVCLVDSAGTMLPDDVRNYVSRMKDALRVEIGFHGHDNLSLGMANVLAAIEAGAQVVDTTLQGIGRGGGNAVTEILVAILHKQGVSATGIDLNRLMDVSERVVRPLLKGKGHDPLNITAGFAGFHSSALEMILRHADRHHIDPRDLIVEVSGIDRVAVTDALVEEVAAGISKRHQGRSGMHVVDRPESFADQAGANRSFSEAAADAARKARAVAIKSGRTSVFNVVAAPAGRGRSGVSHFVQEEFDAVIASAEVHDQAAAAALVAAVGGEIDLWLADADVQPGGWSPASVLQPLVDRSRFLAYRDGDTWLRAVDLQIASVVTDDARHRRR